MNNHINEMLTGARCRPLGNGRTPLLTASSKQGKSQEVTEKSPKGQHPRGVLIICYPLLRLQAVHVVQCGSTSTDAWIQSADGSSTLRCICASVEVVSFVVVHKPYRLLFEEMPAEWWEENSPRSTR